MVYSERAVADLLLTLGQLSDPNTTIFLAGELRNGNEFLLSLLSTPFWFLNCAIHSSE